MMRGHSYLNIGEDLSVDVNENKSKSANASVRDVSVSWFLSAGTGLVVDQGTNVGIRVRYERTRRNSGDVAVALEIGGDGVEGAGVAQVVVAGGGRGPSEGLQHLAADSKGFKRIDNQSISPLCQCG